MKIKRIITAENGSGVTIESAEVLDSADANVTTDIWGFDQWPFLPLTPEDVLGASRAKPIFGPPGSVRVTIISVRPETRGQRIDLERSKLDVGPSGVVPGSGDPDMHRTDSVDFLAVIDGETDVAYPGVDGKIHELHLQVGDLLVHNGVFHAWHNRAKKACTVLAVQFGAERRPRDWLATSG